MGLALISPDLKKLLTIKNETIMAHICIRKDKETFIADLKNRIKAREQIVKDLEIVKKAVEKFDGKVYNKRFDTYLLGELQKKDPNYRVRTYCGTTSYYSADRQFYVDVDFYIKYDSGNNECFTYRIILSENRIKKGLTDECDVNPAWLTSFIDGTNERKEVIKKYDKFMKQAEKLNEMVREFNELPHVFRQNITNGYGFTIYIG